MLFKSPVLAQASGSLAGSTYSRNKGGMYIRSRSLVITPKTSQQLAAQTALATLSTRWQTLTAAQRTGWRNYALNVPLLNKLGDPRTIPELSMYVRLNSYRLQVLGAAGIIDTAPTTYSVGVLTPPTITATHPSTIALAFTNTDAWAITTGGYLFAQVSRPQSPTVIFPPGMYRYAGQIAGNTGTPPTSPMNVTSPFPFVVGNRVFVRLIATNSDGRVSSPITVSGIAV